MIEEFVMSTVLGEHTGKGSVITKTDTPGVEITTGADSVEVHPDEFVTSKVNTPSSRFVIVLLAPLPAVVNPPGKRVITHEPGEGSPLNTTLPDGTASVGWVMVPTTGAVGVGG